MSIFRSLAGILLVLTWVTTALCAQADSKRTSEQVNPSSTHKSDFDFLLGDWEFTSESPQYGKFGGLWSFVRLETGQILDEYRVTGNNGQTFYITAAIRAYNAVADRWESISMDPGAGLQSFATDERIDSEMHSEQKAGGAAGKQITLRVRYYNIQPDHFSWSADRSTDGGQTWTKDFQRIEANR
ncbi:MAG: hypothetical protein JO217_11970, partial [Acidobacteriaceae bacterium]|nr:hypothetical protein [Acidobacteriaceae bacterium]